MSPVFRAVLIAHVYPKNGAFLSCVCLSLCVLASFAAWVAEGRARAVLGFGARVWRRGAGSSRSS